MQVKIIPAGTLLYHGTSVKENYKKINKRFFWLTDVKEVAKNFSILFNGNRGAPRVLTFEVTSPITLAIIPEDTLHNRQERLVEGGKLKSFAGFHQYAEKFCDSENSDGWESELKNDWIYEKFYDPVGNRYEDLLEPGKDILICKKSFEKIKLIKVEPLYKEPIAYLIGDLVSLYKTVTKYNHLIDETSMQLMHDSLHTISNETKKLQEEVNHKLAKLIKKTYNN